MPEIVPPQMLTLSQILALFPQPLRLIIEGSTGSGKTWLAQKLALALTTHIEVWSYFYFAEVTEAYPLIPNVPVYQPSYPLCEGDLPSIWEKRATFWLDNADIRPKYILIDEIIPRLIRLEVDNFLLHFLRNVGDTNIVLTTQSFDTKRGMAEHSLDLQFSLIRLGLNAMRYAKFVLENPALLQQLEAAQYPCLFQDRAFDLAGIA